MTEAPTPRRAGASRLVKAVTIRSAAVAASIALGAAGTAYGQVPTDTTETPSQTMQTPTETTPTETTPTAPAPTQTTPTETTPAETTPTPSPEPTAAPNEYVESVPTGGGQTPVSRAAPVTPAPASPADTVTDSVQNTRRDEPAARVPDRKKKRAAAGGGRRADEVAARPDVAPAVPTTPASADPGEPANPVLLGIALLFITGAALGAAVARRDRAAI